MSSEVDAAGDGWLDMSVYPDQDPDTVLSAGEHDLLSSALAVDDAGLPDAVWDHLLATVLGDDPATEDTDDTDGADGTDGADDPVDDASSWSVETPEHPGAWDDVHGWDSGDLTDPVDDGHHGDPGDPGWS